MTKDDMLALAEGQTYQNRRGDLRGPMRKCLDYFLDQYGFQYLPDGTAVGHAHASTANIDLSTAGTTDGWRAEPDDEFDWVCQREEDERDDEADLLRATKDREAGR